MPKPEKMKVSLTEARFVKTRLVAASHVLSLTLTRTRAALSSFTMAIFCIHVAKWPTIGIPNELGLLLEPGGGQLDPPLTITSMEITVIRAGP